MYCANCGFKLDENAKFCKNCGIKILDTNPEEMATPVESQTTATQPKKTKKGGILKPLLLIGGVLLALLLGYSLIRMLMGSGSAGASASDDQLSCKYAYQDEEVILSENIDYYYQNAKVIRIEDHILQSYLDIELTDDELDEEEEYLLQLLAGLDDYDGVKYSVSIENNDFNVDIKIDYDIDASKMSLDAVMNYLDFQFSNYLNSLSKEELKSEMMDYDFKCE